MPLDLSIPSDMFDALERWAKISKHKNTRCELDPAKQFIILGGKSNKKDSYKPKDISNLALSVDKEDFERDDIKEIIFEHSAFILDHRAGVKYYPETFDPLPGKRWQESKDVASLLNASLGNPRHKIDLKKLRKALLGKTVQEAELLVAALGLRMATASKDGRGYAHTQELDGSRFFVDIAQNKIIAVGESWG